MRDTGFELEVFPLDESIRNLVREENWQAVDDEFTRLTQEGASIFQFVRKFHEFSRIETLLSIRNSENEWEEDGIWHDDGSRVFAFSLSLTENAGEIEGGNLELRKKNTSTSQMIPTPEFGTGILFLTGIHGFEHRTREVIRGRRIILVGWCC